MKLYSILSDIPMCRGNCGKPTIFSIQFEINTKFKQSSLVEPNGFGVLVTFQT